MLLLVEGSYDVAFLTVLSEILSRDQSEIPRLGKLSQSGRVVCIPCGGSPAPWTHRLSPFGCSEVHIFDRECGDETKLRVEAASQVNARPGCRAFLTRHRSLEGYLHVQAIQAAGGPLLSFAGEDCVPTLLANAWHTQEPFKIPWSSLDKRSRLKKVQRAKSWLNHRAVLHMTPELLRESDEHGDIESWLLTIADMLRSSEADPIASSCRNILCPHAL